ncbi:MAG: V-type ATPase subunit [Deltaproteobacteria bacterium]|nr:V-type ATPase subunit [Deltaproteobacteria bacterium]
MNLINTQYSFMAAYLKGEESRSVTSEQIGEVLQRSATMQDALEIIGETDIGLYLIDQPIPTFDDADEYLWRYLGECLRRFEGFRTPPEMSRIAGLYIERHDVMNIRIALRMLLKRVPSALVPLGAIHSTGLLPELAAVREKEDISSILTQCSLGEYVRTVEEINEKETQSVTEGEATLQNLYYQRVLEAFEGMGDGHLLEKAIRTDIDMENLRTVFRVSLAGGQAAGMPILRGGRMLSEGIVQELLTLKIGEITGRLENTGYHLLAQDISKGFEKDGVITMIDRILERYRFRMLYDLLSPRILSTVNMLWYLEIKELEVRNLRLTFKMLADGIPPTEIKELVIAA